MFLFYSRSEAEATAILNQYDKEAESYKQIMSVSGLGFTVEGFLSYLSVRVISSATNPVYISLNKPAKDSYVVPWSICMTYTIYTLP